MSKEEIKRKCCPHCKSLNIRKIKQNKNKDVGKYKCNNCHKIFNDCSYKILNKRTNTRVDTKIILLRIFDYHLHNLN